MTKSLKFGNTVENIAASDRNPIKRGIFVRYVGSKMAEYVTKEGSHSTPADNLRLAAQSAAPVGENISKDSTLYVERSMVRIGAIGSSDETMLEYVDSLPVFTAADFAAPPPSPPEVSGEIVLIPTADQIEPILEDYFAGFALEARKRCAQRIFDLCVVMSGLPIAKSDNRIANPGNTEP